MKNDFLSTIAAVSTPRGKGGVALIRISGEEAVAVAGRCFSPKCGKSACDLAPRTAYFGDILDDGAPIDDGMLTVFRAPNSYTGEDLVEISCHGGVLVTRRVLEAVFKAGATPAVAGEFTRRAFVNGKLSLTKAEAVGEILEAKSDAQLRIAASQRRGVLTEKIDAAAHALTSLIADVYARIDYPDEDLAEIGDDEFARRAEEIRNSLKNLRATYRSGSAIFEGIKTVICGAPNRGKSSLYNAIAGEDAAIVTEIAGTTRDILERDIPLGSVLLHLTDTAGIRDTADVVEQIGVSRAKERLAEAELVICVLDGSKELSDEDISLFDSLKDVTAPKIAVLNKSDLGKANLELPDFFEKVIRLSAKSGDISELCEAVEKLFIDEKIDTHSDAIITSARQAASLDEAILLIGDAINTAATGMGADLASSDLERAVATLNELDGKAVSENVVSEIFGRFCVGK
ncbi:MAG: tRNA uridine-5-carboxymethylaminomethyl(34) synthesis GTPase MnmE [Ruminococcaceae bacterium]|nr:tRNA uridine-5-carboxymethylaminomethyl(34) synthesis GTPase MnmE [Oscillospiraceae bacterium]